MKEPIATRPAANKRSPNRKPRYRRQMRSNTRQIQKEAVLGAYLQGKDLEGASQDAMASPDLVRYWETSDPEFRVKAREAREKGKAHLEGKLLTKGEKAVDNYDAFLDSESEKLRLVASQDVLDRLGVGREKKEEEEAGRNQPLIDNRRIIVNILGDPVSREAALTLLRALENGASRDSS